MPTGFLGLDLGGTGAKAGVFDEQGKLLGLGHATYMPQTSPDGYSELPIEDIHDAARQAIRQAVEASRADIAAMAVSSQGQTFVSLDEHDRPVYPVIMWYDSRATAEAAEMARAYHAANPPAPHPVIEAIATAPKIMWLRRHRPEAIKKARRHLLLPEYIAYCLTGEAVTDASTASSTALYAEDAPAYSPHAFEAAGIDPSQMARIQFPAEPIAAITLKAAAEWGLPPQCLLVTGTNDQYAGALGAGNCRPGILSETTGSCLALVTLTKQLPNPIPTGLLGGRFPIRDYQFGLAYSKTAGLVIRWFNGALCPDQSLEKLEALAREIPIGSHGVVALPHFDGMVSPTPTPDARGAFLNLSLNHTLGDMYRAVLESIAYCLRENIELLERNGFSMDVMRSIGGGAKSDLWMQIKADVTGLPAERPLVTEAACLGAAMLAAVGAGRFHSIAECSESFYHVQQTFQPDPQAHERYGEFFQTYQRYVQQLYGA